MVEMEDEKFLLEDVMQESEDPMQESEGCLPKLNTCECVRIMVYAIGILSTIIGLAFLLWAFDLADRSSCTVTLIYKQKTLDNDWQIRKICDGKVATVNTEDMKETVKPFEKYHPKLFNGLPQGIHKCLIKMRKSGRIVCTPDIFNKTFNCEIWCKKHKHRDEVVKRTYICKQDGTWEPALPRCNNLKVKEKLVDTDIEYRRYLEGGKHSKGKHSLHMRIKRGLHECSIKVRKPGEANCSPNAANKTFDCEIWCKKHKNQDEVEKGTYICKQDGTWEPALPRCAIPKGKPVIAKYNGNGRGVYVKRIVDPVNA